MGFDEIKDEIIKLLDTKLVLRYSCIREKLFKESYDQFTALTAVSHWLAIKKETV